MKNTKRILAVVIALTMVIGMFASVSAAGKKWYSDAVTYLEAAGIAKIGTKAETKLTRAEFVLWVAKLEAGQFFVDSNKWKNDGLADVIVFSDVDTSVDGIYRAAINYCYQRHFVRGNGDGTFSPDAKVTLAQASAVIVRLMGYDNKVTNLEDWQYNYFNVANNYCNAFDATFAANLPAVDAEYELTYGEAAYLLATILNWGQTPQDAAAIAQLPCLTAEGENLGEKFPRGTFSASSQVAIVTGVEHIAVYYDLYGGTGKIYGDDGEFNGYTSEGPTLNYKFATDNGPDADWTAWGFDADTKTLDFVTNVIDPASTVTLNLVNEDGTVTEAVEVDVAKFQQLVRVALGKSKNVDVTNGEIFNLGDYINNGSVIGVEVSGDTVKSVVVATEDAGTRLISDTFLVLTTTAEKWVRKVDGSIVRYGKYPYLANAEGSSMNNTPALPTAYTDAKKVSVSGSKLTLGETTYSIVATRTVGANELVVYDATAEELAPLTAKKVAEMLPNTAAGEHDVEFTDVDGDGYFDIAVIRDYEYFKYVDKTNADPSSGTSGAKYDQGGAVVIDKVVENSANSDSWKYTAGKTSGKIQLVVQASNKHHAQRVQYYGNTQDAHGNAVVAPEYPMQFYKVVDIADLTTAYIESVEKDLVTVGAKTYYQATLVSVADGTKAKVLIPTSVEFVDEYTTVPVEIAGQKASVKVYSGDWMPFLATEEAAREAGIDQITNVEGTGAWLVDRTVKYATKNAVAGTSGQAGDMVCVLLDTTTTATTGFIVNVAKTETGDNTYNVTIAKSGSINDNNWVSAVDAYWTSMRWGGWWAVTTYGNGGSYAFNANNGLLPVYPGTTVGYQNATIYSRTARQFLTSMGFTDVDAWANNLDGWQARNGLQGNTNSPFARMGNIWAYARNAVKAAGSAAVLDMTLAEIKTAYDSVAGNMDSLVTQYNYILVNDLKGTGIDTSITLRSVFDHNVWTGFDADTFAANVLANVENVSSNQMYGYFLIHIADIVASGYLNTSKMKMGSDASDYGYFTSVTSAKGATSVGTYEVRASASSIWDWDNYSVYYGIFAGQTLKEHADSNTNYQGDISVNSINDEDIANKQAALTAAQAALTAAQAAAEADPEDADLAAAVEAAEADVTAAQAAYDSVSSVKTKKATYDAKKAALAAAENAVVTAQNTLEAKQETLTAAQEALTAAQTAAAADPTNEELAAAVETAQGAVETAQGAVTTAQAALADAQAAVEPAQAEFDEAATAYFAVVEFTQAVTGQDLTYVSVKKDGANTSYVLQYLDESTSIYADASRGWARYYTSANNAFGSAGNCKGTMSYYKEVANEASFWNQYSSGIILTDVSEALKNIVIPDGRNETQTELVLEVATDPYYKKIYNSKGEVTSFERHWVVGEYTVTITSKYASGDPQKTYIPVVDFEGVQIKVTTQEEKDEWEKQTTVDVNGVISTYEVNSQGYLFKVNTRIPEFKYDANGKKVINHTYDFANMVRVPGNVAEDVVAEDDEIVGLIGLEEMTDRTEKGYFPGAYKVTYDGVTYIAAGDAPVVIMTPNFKTGDLDGTATTVEGLAKAGAEVFVTYAQVAGLTAPDGGKSLDMISVIGELVDKTAQPVDTETTYLVYLAHDGVTIEALELGQYFVVRSTHSASVIPSCEDFGSIYRKYSTYTEAKYAAEVDLAIGTGYYTVKEDGEIVKAAGATKNGSITEVDQAGNLKATMDGKKVDATNYKWTFIYEDFEGNLHVAGSSIKVTIKSAADVVATLKSAKDALATAEANYAQAKALKLSAEMQATLKGVVDEKEAALETAKQNAITKYLDGQFWGTASSPVYNYVTSYRYTYQKEPAPITFQYTVIDGTYVVFVSSFFA